MGANEATAFLQDELLEAGFSREEVRNLGSHSLKATLLTFAARSHTVRFEKAPAGPSCRAW